MPGAESEFQWYWGYGEDAEEFEGGFPTRLEAIASAFAVADPGSKIAICEADKKTFSDRIFHADRVMEDFEEANEDCWGEDGASGDATDEACAELEDALIAAFKAWREKHQPWTAWVFDTMRNHEVLTVPWTLGAFWRDLRWRTPWRVRGLIVRLRRRFLSPAS